MNINEIKALAELMTANGLSCIKVQEEGLKLKLERMMPPAAAPVLPAVAPAAAIDPLPAAPAAPAVEGTPVASPMVGVFYSSPSPDAEPFVTIGSAVKKGDILGILEAMKLMNEVVAECDGIVADICVKNGDVAEYGQPLFYIK